MCQGSRFAGEAGRGDTDDDRLERHGVQIGLQPCWERRDDVSCRVVRGKGELARGEERRRKGEREKGRKGENRENRENRQRGDREIACSWKERWGLGLIGSCCEEGACRTSSASAGGWRRRRKEQPARAVDVWEGRRDDRPGREGRRDFRAAVMRCLLSFCWAHLGFGGRAAPSFLWSPYRCIFVPSCQDETVLLPWPSWLPFLPLFVALLFFSSSPRSCGVHGHRGQRTEDRG